MQSRVCNFKDLNNDLTKYCFKKSSYSLLQTAWPKIYYSSRIVSLLLSNYELRNLLCNSLFVYFNYEILYIPVVCDIQYLHDINI